ncbi:hypothetical protein PsorP6_010882 [Peronosclerospora sorghi]|uniref:Uncharacterized protein n=1 Tax=Peronosclerospora sorghi TaxID=230839 RepID=A0ACC0VW20_9STRA|nr:hypothetical protein PsorP6_010882 [Peronosclerospora sorghi]
MRQITGFFTQKVGAVNGEVLGRMMFALTIFSFTLGSPCVGQGSVATEVSVLIHVQYLHARVGQCSVVQSGTPCPDASKPLQTLDCLSVLPILAAPIWSLSPIRVNSL